MFDSGLPVEAMRYSLKDHYRELGESIPVVASAAAKDGTDYNTLINRIVELANARYSR